MTTSDSETFTIGEASERTGLPESTIRFYDREFSDFLTIERGQQNQRIFREENLKDLEYIRFLIKRENLSVEEVGERLAREEEFKGEPLPAEESFDSRSNDTELTEKLHQLQEQLEQIQDELSDHYTLIDQIEQDQETILKLLDMNLQRYNEVVQHLPDSVPPNNR